MPFKRFWLNTWQRSPTSTSRAITVLRLTPVSRSIERIDAPSTIIFKTITALSSGMRMPPNKSRPVAVQVCPHKWHLYRWLPLRSLPYFWWEA